VGDKTWTEWIDHAVIMIANNHKIALEKNCKEFFKLYREQQVNHMLAFIF
jgi:Fe-S cluster biosynthesis and repair protein YggX